MPDTAPQGRRGAHAGPTDAELEAAVAWVWAQGGPLDPLSAVSNHQCALAALLEWYLTKRAYVAAWERLCAIDRERQATHRRPMLPRGVMDEVNAIAMGRDGACNE